MRSRFVAALLVAGSTALVLAPFAGPRGVGAQDAGQGPRHVRIGASGDILFHTRVVDAAAAHDGFDHLFSGLRPLIAEREIAFANLETPLSLNRNPSRGDPPLLGAPPESADALARAGLDVLSVANNHAWDQRDVGMVDTLATLARAGITSVGAAPALDDAAGPVFVERDGVRVAFVAYTVVMQGHPGTRRPRVRIAEWDEARARRVLARARESADVVVASMHWGLAYRTETRSEQRSRARRLIDLGADVVLGHGPHVLQPVERLPSPRGQALVVYSLGNLISNQGYRFRHGRRERGVELPLRAPETRDGVWLRVDVGVPSPGQVSVDHIEAVPLFTRNNFWDEERRRAPGPDIQVMPLSRETDEALRTARRRAIERVLGPEVHLLP